jgi:cytochrome c oxidase subunit 4
MSESHSPEDIKKHVRTYLVVFGSLAVLTIVTVAVGYMELSIWPALIVALAIATLKSGLVAAHFMHLITEQKMILHLLILTFVFLGIMFILFISAYNDQEGVLAMANIL